MRRVSGTVLVAVLGVLLLAACADPASQAGGDAASSTEQEGEQPSIQEPGPDDPTSSGSGQPPPTTTPPTTTPPTTTPPPAGASLPAELTVTVDDGSGGVTTYTLRCEPAGGDHPDPGGACAALAAAEGVFAPPDPGLVCTEIYGGPQSATVTGTLAGEQVNGTFGRANGCEIARWDALAPLLVNPGGVN